MVDPVFGCLLMTSKLDADGYAYHGKTRAHIAAWTAKHGPVPDGRFIDHACRRRNCKALAHLEAVTQSENEKRKSFSYRMLRTHCQHGHAGPWLVTPEGGRVCIVCSRAA